MHTTIDIQTQFSFLIRLAKASLVTVAFLLAMSSSLEAAVIWDWMTTDGTDTATGQLTTDGTEANANVVGNTFGLLSIDSAALNGVPIANWDPAGSAPPFNFAFGLLESQGGGAGDFFSGDTDLFALGSSNSINIGNPAESASSSAGNDPLSASHYSFFPTMTTFTVRNTSLPEPSSLVSLGLAVVIYVSTGRRILR